MGLERPSRSYAKVPTGLMVYTRALRGDCVAQCGYMYLYSNPHTGMLGLGHLPVAYMAADLGWSQADATHALKTCEEAGLIVRDGDLLWVRDALGDEIGPKTLSPDDNRSKRISRELIELARSGSRLVGEIVEHYSRRWPEWGSAIRADLMAAGYPLEEAANVAPPKPLASPSEAMAWHGMAEHGMAEREVPSDDGLLPMSDEELWAAFVEERRKCHRLIGKKCRDPALTQERKRLLKKLRDRYGDKDLLEAFAAMHLSDWHMGRGWHRKTGPKLGPEQLLSITSKVNQIETYLELAENGGGGTTRERGGLETPAVPLEELERSSYKEEDDG